MGLVSMELCLQSHADDTGRDCHRRFIPEIANPGHGDCVVFRDLCAEVPSIPADTRRRGPRLWPREIHDCGQQRFRAGVEYDAALVLLPGTDGSESLAETIFLGAD